MSFDWKTFANMITDDDAWKNGLKLIFGFGGRKSDEAWQELQNMQGYYSSPLFDGTEYESDNSSSLGDVLGDTLGTDSIMSPADLTNYFNGLLSSVGAENDANRKYNSAEAQAARDWQSEENEKNRVWQTDMANSAYQRAVTDMKAAGLNPALAAMNGSTSTPTGVVGAGHSASYNVGGGDTFSSILSSVSGLVSAISQFLPANKTVQVIKSIGNNVK